MKLSIYFIVKDEEVMIEEALKSIVGADEIVVCIDDQTTDKTEEIARKYTDKIHKFKWEDDFAKAKNNACSKCTGDWVMSMDGDLRLEEGGIEKIREIIKDTKLDVANIILKPINDLNKSHRRGKIYRNNGKIFYTGKAHEDLNVIGKDAENGILPVIYYDYSPNHYKDPDRYIRILTKSVEEEPNNPRWKFYLAREYFYKKEYKTAIKIFQEYLSQSKYLAEIVEAQFLLAKCHWFSQQGDKAREICVKAVINNPDHRGALLLMSEMHYEPNKSKWKHIANNATNKDVMFKL